MIKHWILINFIEFHNASKKCVANHKIFFFDFFATFYYYTTLLILTLLQSEQIYTKSQKFFRCFGSSVEFSQIFGYIIDDKDEKPAWAKKKIKKLNRTTSKTSDAYTLTAKSHQISSLNLISQKSSLIEGKPYAIIWRD